MTLSNTVRPRSGSVLPLALLVALIVGALAWALTTQAMEAHRSVRRQVLANRAHYLAESGLQRGFTRIVSEPGGSRSEEVLGDLDPPNTVSIRYWPSSEGGSATLESTGRIDEVSVTLRATVQLGEVFMNMRSRGKP